MNSINREDIESTLLGCMIRNANLLIDGCEQLNEQNFTNASHRSIFRALKDIYTSKAKYIDSTLVFSKLENLPKNNISKDLIDSLYSIGQPIKFAYHLSALKELTAKQQINSLLDDAKSSIFLNSPSTTINNVIESLIKIEQSKSRINIVSTKDVLEGCGGDSKNSILDKIQEVQKSPKDVLSNSVPTGFIDMDRVIGGLGKSNMVILAARPSMGKTGLAINIAENIAKKGNSVGFISLEMSPEQLLYRMISSESEVNMLKLLRGPIHKSEFLKIGDAIHRIKDYKIYIEEMGATSMSKLSSTIRKMKHIYNIDVLIIDYLQLLSYSNNTSNLDNRQQEISNISRAIKLIAKDLNICILCLSQLSRKVEERPDKRPKMSDLRESGSLEQDADQVMLLYRPEYYSQDKEIKEISTPQINVAKNRHGPTGIVNLTFKPNIIKFGNLMDTTLLE